MTRALLVLVVLSLLVAASAQAVPVNPDQRVELGQPSGAPFTAKPFGDEWYHGYETTGGFTILNNRRTRAWEYAREASGGKLVPSGRRPGRDRPTGFRRHLRDRRALASIPETPAQRGALRTRGLQTSRAPAPPNAGAQHSLVILAQFTDQASLGTTAADWNARFFGASESVKDYYNQVSYGNLSLVPATESSGTPNDGVIGWIPVGVPHPKVTELGDPVQYERAKATARNAIYAADPYIDYASYDTDGSGVVTADELHITVIPAGWEAATLCETPAVWGHKGYMEPWETARVDGKFAGVDYTMFGEKHCDRGPTPNPRMAQLGIMVHEMGHDLDMPDLYDTVDGRSLTPVGKWSIMALGSWLALPGQAAGSSPPHPDGFLKYYEGWLAPRGLTGPQNASIGQAEGSTGDAVRLLDNPNGVDWTFQTRSGTGEYFLVENRQRVGYDRALPGCGLLIWHVDETRQPQNGANNNEARPLLGLQEADNNGQPTQATDVWLGNRTFDRSSAPSSNLYGGALSGVSISSFSAACAPTMSASVTDVTAVVPPPDPGTTTPPPAPQTIPGPAPTVPATPPSAGPSPAQIASSLSGDLGAILKALKRLGLKGVMRGKSVVIGGVSGLRAGTAQFTLQANAAAAGARARGARPVVVATGTVRFGKAGRGALRMTLNRRGRQLMRRARQLKVNAILVFTEASGRRSAKTGTVTLKRKGQR